MTRQGIAGVERKCRSEACGQWSFFKPDERSDRCRACGEPYGVATLGLDVTKFKSPAVKTPKLPGQTEAVDVPKPKPGEFGYRGRR